MSATDAIVSRLEARGLELPKHCRPRFTFIPWRRTGNLIVFAGQVCEWHGEIRYSGQVGVNLDMATAQKAAVMCLLNLLFHVRDSCGGRLDAVRHWVRLGGFVSCAPGFPDTPKVINAASELLIELYGEAGKHARTAIGVAALPGGAAVEIDGMVEIQP